MEKLILGHDCISNTDSHITGLNNNVLVIGGSGSGKTMSYLEPNLLEKKESNIIVSIPKRNLVEKYMLDYQN